MWGDRVKQEETEFCHLGRQLASFHCFSMFEIVWNNGIYAPLTAKTGVRVP